MFFSLPNHRENHSKNDVNKKHPPITDNNEMLMQQTNCISTFFTQLSARNDFCRKQLIRELYPLERYIIFSRKVTKVATNIFTKNTFRSYVTFPSGFAFR